MGKIKFSDNALKLTAESINEPAKYFWYNQAGDYIDEGEEINIDLPEVSCWYKLEVIADEDNYKDYDSVYVNIPNGYIVSLTPNPANTLVQIEYFLSDAANTATLRFYNSLGNIEKQENLNITENTKTISLSGLINGTYSVVLLINGIQVDSKALIKQ